MNPKWVMRGFYAVLLGAILFLGGLSVKDLIHPPPVEKVEAKPKVTREDALDEVRKDVQTILSGKDLMNEWYHEDWDYYYSEMEQKRSLNNDLNDPDGYEFDEQDKAEIEELSKMITVYLDELEAWSQYRLEDTQAPEAKKKSEFLKDFYAGKVEEMVAALN